MIHSGVGTSNLLVSQVSCIECFQKGNSFWHLYTQHIFHLCHSLNDNAAQNVRFFHLKFIAPPHSILQCCSPIVTLMLYIAVHNICIWNKHFYFQCMLMIEGISSSQSMSKLESTSVMPFFFVPLAGDWTRPRHHNSISPSKASSVLLSSAYPEPPWLKLTAISSLKLS